MERINQFETYKLAQALTPIKALADKNSDLEPKSIDYMIWLAVRLTEQLIANNSIPLGVSKSSANELHEKLSELFQECRRAREPEEPALIPLWKLALLASTIEKFETVFGEEMAEAAAYVVPRRGIFYTPALVDAADECFPRDLIPHIPQKARTEWRAAGRCFAFNLLSASGFHVARAVEGVMEAYFQIFAKQPGKALKSWGDYLAEFEKMQKAGITPLPEEKTLAEFKQMKDDYRNPIMHPRVVLTEGDAKMLFNNGESSHYRNGPRNRQGSSEYADKLAAHSFFAGNRGGVNARTQLRAHEEGYYCLRRDAAFYGLE